MKPKTRQKLIEAWDICDKEDRSIEYTLQFLQDFANVDFDCALNFMEKHSKQENRRCMVIEAEKNYKPFGEEWEKEINKFTKKELIMMLKASLQKNKPETELQQLKSIKESDECEFCKEYKECE